MTMLAVMIITLFLVGIGLVIISVVALFKRILTGEGKLKLPWIEVSGQGAIAVLVVGVVLLLTSTVMYSRHVAQANEADLQRRERARLEATQAVADARALLDQTVAELKTAPKGKGTKADLEMMFQDVEASRASISESAEKITSEDFLGARDTANAAKAALKQVLEDITAARKRPPELKKKKGVARSQSDGD